ncbi:MAG: hypothetical protein ACKVQC_09145 [Elusimicrobiota bacterium]
MRIIFLMFFMMLFKPLSAHEADCPYCELPLVQNTKEIDNEVVLKYGKKRIEYRCVLCAIADAKKSYSGDVTILAPTELKGKTVEINRKNGVWASPQEVLFIGEKVKHRYCEIGYRALSSKEAFSSYVKKNKVILKGNQPITLTEMVDMAQ